MNIYILGLIFNKKVNRIETEEGNMWVEVYFDDNTIEEYTYTELFNKSMDYIEEVLKYD